MERISRAFGPQVQEQTVLPVTVGRDGPPFNDIHYTQTRIVPVSQAVLRRERVIAGYGPCAFVDAYKVLRTRILDRMREQDWNTLAVTGPGPGCGTSLTAVNLAIGIALEVSQTVLLVDANLREPALHHYFGLAPEFGLGDYLLDNVPVPRLLLKPEGIARLVLLPGTRPLPDAAELLASQKMARLVEELKQRYAARYVVFDLPHLGTPDALGFTTRVDGVVLVVEEGKTGRDEFAQSLESLADREVLGVVLNKAGIGPA